MEIPQLSTASAYVNNLLLARGLLRSGKPVDFASLSVPNTDYTGTSTSATSSHAVVVAEAINLVHDLVLRRDRDSDQLASLAESITDLRHTSHSQASQLDRSKIRAKELQRELDISQSSLRATNSALRSSESSARGLKEELQKTKGALAQVKTQCANDLRKRDIQIQKLKTHLSASQRGTNGRLPPTCTISQQQDKIRQPWVGGFTTSSVKTSFRSENQAPSLEDARYSLKQETTEFLTQLSQNLSDENDSLITLIRSSVDTLRQLQHLPPSNSQPSLPQDGTLKETPDDDMLRIVPTSYEILSADLEYVLGSLRAILTDASFVSIEEVFTRDEEISRLREGWEKMERRWREVVEMMKSWQDRLLHGGATINLEELRFGLGLGEEFQGMRLVDSSSLLVAERGEEPLVQDLPEDEPSFETEDDKPMPLRVHLYGNESLNSSDRTSNSPGSPPTPLSTLREGLLNSRISPTRPMSNEKILKHAGDGAINSKPDDPVLAENKADGKPSEDAQNGSKLPDLKNDNLARRTDTPKAALPPSRIGKHSREQVTARTQERKINPIQSARPTSRRVSATKPTTTVIDPETTPVVATSLIDEANELPMTVEQKLEFAESEARRVSGTSASPSSSSPFMNKIAEASNENSSSELPNAVIINGDTSTGNISESQKQKDEQQLPLCEPQNEVKPQSPMAAKRNGSSKAGKPEASGKNSRNVGAKAIASKASRTVTTRVPTKPPAAATGSVKQKSKPRPPPRDAATKTQRPTQAAEDIDTSMRRSRRKRKSTLSPEELEQLMGLRQKEEAADAES